MCYKHVIGQPFMYPNNDMSTKEFFAHDVSTPCEKYVPNPVFVDAMDKIFTLHADHEQNASTSTVRLAGSTSKSICLYFSRDFSSLGASTWWC